MERMETKIWNLKKKIVVQIMIYVSVDIGWIKPEDWITKAIAVVLSKFIVNDLKFDRFNLGQICVQ